MANQQHLDILKQGVEAWNQWRNEHADVQPDLSRANLSRANLSGAHFWLADLSGANLSRLDLSTTNHKFVPSGMTGSSWNVPRNSERFYDSPYLAFIALCMS